MPLLALLLAVSTPIHGGDYRRSVRTSDGQRLAVFLYLPEQLDPASPWVVLLPDLGASHDAFDAPRVGLARVLRERGLRVATFDWRGTGSSSRAMARDGLDVFLTQDLPAAMAALGDAAPVVLVGWGFGGAVAYAAAAVGPLRSRVRGVVGLDAVVDAAVPNALVDRLLSRGRVGLDLSQELSLPCPDGSDSQFQRLWVHGSDLDDADTSALLRRSLGSLTGAQASAMAEWMKQGRTSLGGAYPDIVAQVEAPVLAVVGPLDNWSHPEFATGILDRLPRSQVRLVRVSRVEGFGGDAGHLGLVTGPLARELGGVIARFAREAMETSEPGAPDGGAR